MGDSTQVHTSDLEKIRDVLALNERHHKARDEMNAATHSSGEVRYSAITTRTIAERARVDGLLDRAET